MFLLEEKTNYQSRKLRFCLLCLIIILFQQKALLLTSHSQIKVLQLISYCGHFPQYPIIFPFQLQKLSLKEVDVNDYALIFLLKLLLSVDLVSKQDGNWNLDCVPRTAVEAMPDWGVGGGGRGDLNSNFVHHVPPGGEVLSSNFVHHVPPGGESLVPTLSTRCATRGEGGP